ncbi:MAG: hypothetical protein ACJAZS_000229 [Alteromonas naphthalenivorans]|jgi:hypothetical protein
MEKKMKLKKLVLIALILGASVNSWAMDISNTTGLEGSGDGLAEVNTTEPTVGSKQLEANRDSVGKPEPKRNVWNLWGRFNRAKTKTASVSFSPVLKDTGQAVNFKQGASIVSNVSDPSEGAYTEQNANNTAMTEVMKTSTHQLLEDHGLLATIAKSPTLIHGDGDLGWSNDEGNHVPYDRSKWRDVNYDPTTKVVRDPVTDEYVGHFDNQGEWQKNTDSTDPGLQQKSNQIPDYYSDDKDGIPYEWYSR